jgi:hypothetical protein
MKKALVLVAYPKVPRTVSRDGMHVSARRDQSKNAINLSSQRMCIIDMGMVRSYRNKSPILEVGGSILRERPNSPTIILKQRLHSIVRQSAINYFVDIVF